MMEKIDHVGIAVRDLGAQIALYRDQLGLEFEGTEEIAGRAIRVAFFKVGESMIELLEATSPESTIAKYLEQHGEGLHHVAYAVENVREAMTLARQRGLSLVDAEPRPGAHRTMVCFLHPKSTGGVLTELVEHPGHP